MSVQCGSMKLRTTTLPRRLDSGSVLPSWSVSRNPGAALGRDGRQAHQVDCGQRDARRDARGGRCPLGRVAASCRLPATTTVTAPGEEEARDRARHGHHPRPPVGPLAAPRASPAGTAGAVSESSRGSCLLDLIVANRLSGVRSVAGRGCGQRADVRLSLRSRVALRPPSLPAIWRMTTIIVGSAQKSRRPTGSTRRLLVGERGQGHAGQVAVDRVHRGIAEDAQCQVA